MPLSDLKPIDKRVFDTGSFEVPPDAGKQESPDHRVLPNLGGWAPGSAEVMFLELTNEPQSNSEIGIDPDVDDVLQVKVYKDPNQKEMLVQYFSVTMAKGSRNAEWQLNFDIWNRDVAPIDTQYTGKWMFTKGKPTVDPLAR